MRHHANKLLIFFAAVLISVSVFSTAPVMAASSTTSVVKKQTAKKANKWVKNKKGFYTYYDSQGKKCTGLTTIKGKNYYFDQKGIQRCGWQQIDNGYYYFRIASGSKAYMMTNTTMNGIRLGKTGKAVLNTSARRQKIKLLWRAQQLSQEIITDNTMTKNQKLKALYDWTQKDSNIRKTNIGSFKSAKANWDIYYAGLVLNASRLPARGDCYTYASVFGYLANTVGYEATVCSSGHHGFVMINQKFYDPSWQKSMPNSFFGRSWDTVAEGLHFRYKSNMRYTKVI